MRKEELKKALGKFYSVTGDPKERIEDALSILNCLRGEFIEDVGRVFGKDKVWDVATDAFRLLDGIRAWLESPEDISFEEWYKKTAEAIEKEERRGR